MQIKVEIPYPPSVNHYYKHGGRGRRILSESARSYRDFVAVKLIGHQRLARELKILIEMYPPDRRKRDVDNGLKAALDALQHGGAYEDDNQIGELTIKRLGIVPGGKLVVTIEEVEA